MGEADGKKDKGNCRDFERGVCSRGNKCKFYHSPDIPQPGQSELPICKDFQNNGCDRKSCKFLHVTPQEEVTYKATGMLPEDISTRSSRKERNTGGSKYDERCKDFMNGVCKRGNCKFLHIPEHKGYGDSSISMYGKRRRDDNSRNEMDTEGGLYHENEMLKRKITDLQRQVIDLREMNDKLYDQNTRYRNQIRGVQTLPSSTLSSEYAKSISVPPIDSSRNFYDDYRKF